MQIDSVLHVYVYIYIYMFFILFSIMVYHKIVNIVPSTLPYNLVVYPSYLDKSLHLLTPTFHPIPLPTPFHLGNHKSVLYISEAASVSYISSFVSYMF